MGCGDEKLSKYLTQTFTAHCNAMRLLLDSRVVNKTMSYNPICASCILLEALIFQGPYKCVACFRRPCEYKTLKPNKSLTWLSLSTVWCLIGATPRGQPWTPAVALPHRRDGLSARRMAVFCTVGRPSI
jgi:hypothetical protein